MEELERRVVSVIANYTLLHGRIDNPEHLAKLIVEEVRPLVERYVKKEIISLAKKCVEERVKAKIEEVKADAELGETELGKLVEEAMNLTYRLYDTLMDFDEKLRTLILKAYNLKDNQYAFEIRSLIASLKALDESIFGCGLAAEYKINRIAEIEAAIRKQRR